MYLSTATVRHIVATVDVNLVKVLAYLREHEVTDRTGGCFALGMQCKIAYQSHAPSTRNRSEIFQVPALITSPVGPLALRKVEKYAAFAREKNERLLQHREHVSSAQSRDPALERWGGSIKAQISALDIQDMFNPADNLATADVFLSFSGLPEKGDEALMLLMARELGWPAPESRIVEASDNEIARAMLSRS